VVNHIVISPLMRTSRVARVRRMAQLKKTHWPTYMRSLSILRDIPIGEDSPLDVEDALE
jgi:hypothetical protein